MKLCPRCGSDGPFGLNRSRKDGLHGYCMVCRREDGRVARAPASLRGEPACRGRKTAAMVAAWRAVSAALADGRLVKPDGCANCDRSPVEAHHYLGYAPADRLTVRWLCRSCHQMYHARGYAA